MWILASGLVEVHARIFRKAEILRIKSWMLTRENDRRRNATTN
jgi:hypothetical protein